MPTRRIAAGFTLIECSVVCAIVAILSAVALPSFQDRQLRAGRFDGIAALTKVQVAQEQYRNTQGLYAAEVSPLKGVAVRSAEGRYQVHLEVTGPDSYRATAAAQGTQAKDRHCAQITLEVRSGFPQYGPDASCWNR